MNTTSLLHGARALLLGTACAVAAQAYALDAYDGVNLRVPMVDVNGTVYTNVVTNVAGIVSLEGGAPRGNFDSYDTATGRLFIPAVVYGGATYTNVTVAVSLANVTHVGGTMSSSPAFVLISNSNDRTIRSYRYGVKTASQDATPVSTVTDAALANSQLDREPKLFLDKANGLLFDAVRLASGGTTVTTFRIDLATGSITPIAGASANLPGSEGTVDTFNHQVISLGNSGVILYPYDPVSGIVQPAISSSNDPTFQNVMSYDQQDNLLFATNGTQLTTYSFAPASAQPVPIAQTASTIDSSNVAYDVSSGFDLGRKLLFVSDSPTASSSTTLTAVPFSASTVGPAGNPVVTNNARLCGVDPSARLLIMASTNSSALTIFSYAGNGTINASPTLFSPAAGASFGGCADIDPANHIAFFSSNGSFAAVTFYVYDATSGFVTVAGAQAGSIPIATGSGQIHVLSTESLAVN